MSIDAVRRLLTYVVDQTVLLGVEIAAVSSALYCYTQLLPEENLLLNDFAYDAETPLEITDDGTLYKARRWEDCKGVYKLVLWKSKYPCQQSAEAAILEQTRGVPNVLEYITHATTEGQPGGFLLITERLQGGTKLSGLLATPVVQELTPVQRLSMARQIIRDLLEALAGLHSRGIAHGSVSAESLYVRASKTEDDQRIYQAKLIDFSSAVDFREGEQVQDSKLIDLAGKDINTVAPEGLVRNLKGTDNGYPVSPDAADMWSTGVVLMSIAALQPPFKAESGGARELARQHKAWEAALRNRRSQHPLLKLLDTAPRDFARLVVLMLQVDPVRRISALQALKHPFLLESSS